MSREYERWRRRRELQEQMTMYLMGVGCALATVVVAWIIVLFIRWAGGTP